MYGSVSFNVFLLIYGYAYPLIIVFPSFWPVYFITIVYPTFKLLLDIEYGLFLIISSTETL